MTTAKTARTSGSILNIRPGAALLRSKVNGFLSPALGADTMPHPTHPTTMTARRPHVGVLALLAVVASLVGGDAASGALPISGQATAAAQPDGTILVTATVRNTGTRAATFGVSCVEIPAGARLVRTVTGRYDRVMREVCATRQGTIARNARITAAVRLRVTRTGTRVRMTGSLARAARDPRTSGPLWAVTKTITLPAARACPPPA